MKKVAFFGVLVLSVITLAGCKYLGNSNNNNNNPQSSANENIDTEVEYAIREGEVALFWGDGCPHCVNVDKFLEENNSLIDKLHIKKIEVFNDLKGQKTFMEKVQECQLSTSGVPLLYKDGKCFQGDLPVIEELKKSL